MEINYNLFNKLPIDIIRYIIPYTYNIQLHDLLLDIRNFIETKKYIFKKYKIYNIKYNLICNWYNDISLHSDNNNYYLYIDMSSFPPKNKKFIQIFNIFWGSLVPHNRNKFIKNIILSNN